MSHTGTTAIGRFCLESIDIRLGHITVHTDGTAPMRRRIGVYSDVIDADNRIEGFYRPGGENLLTITVKPKYRTEEGMKAVYRSIYAALVNMLEDDPSRVDEINRKAAAEPSMAVFSTLGD